MVARSVLNPITLSVTGLIGAFQLWETRMENAMRVLRGVELPDISGQLKNYNAAADAWEKFATKVREVQEAYNGVIAASERVEESIDKQAQAEKRRLENQKKIELAQLDLQKANMGEGRYAATRAALEGRYEQGEMAIDQRAEQRKLAEMGRRRGNLEIRAEWKEREARGITAPSEEAERQIDQLHREQVEFAKAELQASKARLKRLEAMSADPLERAKGTWWYAQTYGPSVHGAEARAMERENIARWQIPVDQFESWEQAKRRNAGERARRAGLLDDAAGMRGEAWKLGQELPGLQGDFNERRQLDSETAFANRISREAGAVSQAAAQAQTEQSQLLREATRQIESTGSVARQTAEMLSRQSDLNEVFAREIKRLESVIGNLRR
jgi:hypothetical protein